MEKQSSDSSTNGNAVANQAELYTLERADSPSIQLRVGDVIPVRIKGFAAPEKPVALAPLDSSIDLQKEGWMIMPSSRSDVSFLLVPLRGGHLKLPELAIRTEKGGGPETIIGKTTGFETDIESVAKPGEKVTDFMPPAGLPFPFKEAALYGGTGLIVVVTAAYLLIKRMIRSKPTLVLPPLPAKPEDDVALEKLRQIEAQAQWKTGKLKPHYFAVSEALKEYFERRYGFEALESTSDELIRGLEAHSLSREQVAEVRVLFDKLDFVKFTDGQPSESEPQEIVALARALILKTRKPHSSPILPEGSGRAV